MVLLVDAGGANGDRPMPVTNLGRIEERVRPLAAVGVDSVKVFATGDMRDERASAAALVDGRMARAISEIKEAGPELTVMTESCLCSYTDNGECHLSNRRDGTPDLGGTLEAVAAQAVVQADAGADVVGPAGMLPGSVRAVRAALDESGHHRVEIMPHLIFDSRLYEGYRATMGAVPSSGETRRFQVAPTSSADGVRTALEFIGEGADKLLLEPALTCADVLIALRQVSRAPLYPFSVSGEYRLLGQGYRDWSLLAELFVMLKRSGAEKIMTYAAAELAR